MTDIFKCREEMPSPNDTRIAVRTAQSFQEYRANNLVPASIPDGDDGRNDVQNVVRARRGYTTY